MCSLFIRSLFLSFFFFFNDTATTEIYTLSLHDALPIFFKNFFNADVFLGKRISEQVVEASWNVAASASATASLAGVPTWHEDFRKDVPRINVPTLIIHGDADRIVPIKASGEKTAKLVTGARLAAIKDGPHAVNWTHADEVNAELVNFLGKGAAKRASARSSR